MAITKEDFLDYPELIEEAQQINSISMNPSRTTTGAASWKNPRTGAAYVVTSGGELALAKKIRDDRAIVFGALDISKKVGPAGATSARPASPSAGDSYFDTTLGKPVWYSGAGWVDATGAAV